MGKSRKKKQKTGRNKGCHEIRGIWFSLEFEFELSNRFVWKLKYLNNRYLTNESVKREMNVTTRFLVLDLLYGPSLTAQIPLFRNYRILMDHAVNPEPRGFRENGWRHNDLHSRISINSKFGLFWSQSTILPGTALRNGFSLHVTVFNSVLQYDYSRDYNLGRSDSTY